MYCLTLHFHFQNDFQDNAELGKYEKLFKKSIYGLLRPNGLFREKMYYRRFVWLIHMRTNKYDAINLYSVFPSEFLNEGAQVINICLIFFYFKGIDHVQIDCVAESAVTILNLY